MQVRSEDAATEDCQSIPDVAYSVPRNRLRATVSGSIHLLHVLVVRDTDLNVQPLLRTRRHHLKPSQAVVQECLVSMVSFKEPVCMYTKRQKTDQCAKVSVRSDAGTALIRRGLNNSGLASARLVR